MFLFTWRAQLDPSKQLLYAMENNAIHTLINKLSMQCNLISTRAMQDRSNYQLNEARKYDSALPLCLRGAVGWIDDDDLVAAAVLLVAHHHLSNGGMLCSFLK
jgi:hypothetical protein